MSRKMPIPASAIASKADVIAKTLALGRSHHNQGNLKLAEGCYRRVLELESGNVDALHLLGVIAYQSGAVEDGIRFMKRAARKSPRDPAILINLGAALRTANKNTEAREAYEAALKLKPDSSEAHFNLGRVFLDLEQDDRAIESYRKCIALNPADPDIYVNLGNAYKYKGDGDAAIVAYEQALRLKPNQVEALSNIAAVLVDRGQQEEALAFMDQAIAVDPRPGELRFKRSLIALRLGHFEDGWSDYESRFFADKEQIARRPTPPPYWAGENLAGKAILLWTEQGLGDEILYAGMLPDVIARARKSVIECSPRMVPVFARSFPEATVVRYVDEEKAAATPPESVELQSALASLGRHLRSNFGRFPRHRGYLRADPARSAALRARYQARAPGQPLVGLSWRSKNDAVGFAKSADLANWVGVLTTPGVTFVNLQYGDCAAELAVVKQRLGTNVLHDDEIDPMTNMDDFFAQVSAMDLVISTSNTTVHVAGSLNVQTWVILATGPASLWYWFLDREDSPWYPSVRIFRQLQSGPSAAANPWWSDALDRIGRALQSWRQDRGAGVVGSTCHPGET